MDTAPLPILLFVVAAAGVTVGLLIVGRMLGPSRQGLVKEMPYESGMDPIHDTRRRFDVRFHLVAIAFLVFDVELPDYRARVERVVTIAIEAFDWNCPQHITPRFTEGEVDAATQPLRDRIAELEARLAAARPPA